LAPKRTYTQEELVPLLLQKNQEAFSYLYDNYSKALFGVVYAVVPNQEDAEDILQVLFVKIWKNIESYDAAKGRLYTWMLNLARNLAIDHTRSKHQKAKAKIQNVSDSVYELRNQATENAANDFLGFNAILNELKSDHKEIIDLIYYKGFTHEQASKELNLPLGTVKTKVRQAITILKELTKKEILN
jgi:RNA polymerase sigma-70 factor (ECF subfamily)